MASVYDVANFFVDWANKNDEHMTNLWLNKLLFFAQGQCLARSGDCLFKDANIEAWDLGPVVPSIYRKYKVCGSGRISAIDDDYNPGKFTHEEQILLADIISKYGIYSSSKLVSMTHEDNTPWSRAYVEGRNNEIPPQAMKAFFLLPDNAMPSFEDLVSVDDLDAIGTRRDNEGYLVLPHDEDEDDNWDEL